MKKTIISQTKKMPKFEKKALNKLKLKKALYWSAGTLSIVGIGYFSYNYLNKKYKFLQEQGVSISLLPTPVCNSFYKYEKIIRYDERLNKAYEEYYKGDEASVDIAGFLAFSTLETFLKQWVLSVKPSILNKKPLSIIQVCKFLRSINELERKDYERIKYLVKEVRNNVMHGSIYIKEKVLESISFIKEFIFKHMLIHKEYFA